MSNVVTRWAPTASGETHLGSLFNCLLNFLYARKFNGKFFLRVDGQKMPDWRIEMREGFIRVLDRFGLKSDFVVFQSERRKLYLETVKRLLTTSDQLYFCNCTEQEIALRCNKKGHPRLARDDKYPPPCSIQSIKFFSPEGEEIVPKVTSFTPVVQGFEPDNVLKEDLTTFMPYALHYMLERKAGLSFHFDKKSYIQAIKIVWFEEPLRVFSFWNDNELLLRIEKSGRYCFQEKRPEWIRRHQTESFIFSPVNTSSLSMHFDDFYRQVRLEYYYDDYCRGRKLNLDLSDPKTVVRKRCYQLDVGIYFGGLPDLALTSAIDDKEFGVSHSIRGSDIESFGDTLEREAGQLIDYKANNMYHGLIINENGYKLSKTVRSLPVEHFLSFSRPEVVLGELAFRANLIDSPKISSIEDLISKFNPSRIPTEHICIDEKDFTKQLKT